MRTNLVRAGFSSEDQKLKLKPLECFRDIKVIIGEELSDLVRERKKAEESFLARLTERKSEVVDTPFWIDDSGDKPVAYLRADIFGKYSNASDEEAALYGTSLVRELVPVSLSLMRDKRPIDDESKRRKINLLLDEAGKGLKDLGTKDNRVVEGLEVAKGFVEDPGTQVYTQGGLIVINDSYSGFRQQLLDHLDLKANKYITERFKRPVTDALKSVMNHDYTMQVQEDPKTQAELDAQTQFLVGTLIPLGISRKGKIDLLKLFAAYIKSELPNVIIEQPMN